MVMDWFKLDPAAKFIKLAFNAIPELKELEIEDDEVRKLYFIMCTSIDEDTPAYWNEPYKRTLKKVALFFCCKICDNAYLLTFKKFMRRLRESDLFK